MRNNYVSSTSKARDRVRFSVYRSREGDGFIRTGIGDQGILAVHFYEFKTVCRFEHFIFITSLGVGLVAVLIHDKLSHKSNFSVIGTAKRQLQRAEIVDFEEGVTILECILSDTLNFGRYVYASQEPTLIKCRILNFSYVFGQSNID